MRVFKIVIGTAGLLLLLVLGMVVVDETINYLTRSPGKAALAAHVAFLRECQKRGLDSTAFVGPELQGETGMAYKFAWRNQTAEDAVLVAVLYLPWSTEAWYVPSPSPAIWKPAP